jgi:hypothetical protein
LTIARRSDSCTPAHVSHREGEKLVGALAHFTQLPAALLPLFLRFTRPCPDARPRGLELQSVRCAIRRAPLLKELAEWCHPATLSPSVTK